MKKLSYLIIAIVVVCLISVCFIGCAEKADGTVVVTDMMNREVSVTPGSYSRVLCLGAGALRLYSYVGDVSLLCGVEAIDNTTAENRPVMFDGVSRPYQMAFADTFNTLPICGIGGPNDQKPNYDKILDCNPDIIITQYSDKDVVNKMQSTLNIPVVAVAISDADVFGQKFQESLLLLGKIFNKSERATELNTFVDSQLSLIETKVNSIDVASQKKVYICGLGNWGTTNELMTAQNYGLFNVAKINNVVTGLTKDGIQGIEAEKFMDLAPNMDAIILDAAAVKNIKGKAENIARLQATKAWQDGEVYLEMAYNAYYTNIEIALINTWFAAKSVYLDLFTDIDIEAKTTEITTAFLGKDLNAAIKAKPQSFGGYQKINTATFFA